MDQVRDHHFPIGFRNIDQHYLGYTYSIVVRAKCNFYLLVEAGKAFYCPSASIHHAMKSGFFPPSTADNNVDIFHIKRLEEQDKEGFHFWYSRHF